MTKNAKRYKKNFAFFQNFVAVHNSYALFLCKTATKKHLQRSQNRCR